MEILEGAEDPAGEGDHLEDARVDDPVEDAVGVLASLEDAGVTQNREVLETFVQARFGSFRKRLENLRRSGVYRQTSLGNLALLFATMIKKI